MLKQRWLAVTGVCIAVAAGACSDASTTPRTGRVVVKLTDAPFPLDSLESVDIFVVRVDARPADVPEVEAAAAETEEAEAESKGWTTLATPEATIDLLTLQNGTTTTLGETSLTEGSYAGLRLVIDPSKSSITLKNGETLTGGTTPGVTFPSGSRSGIKIILTKPLEVEGDETTTMVLDFDVANSFVMRGESLSRNGLLFKPVVKGEWKAGTTTPATP
jgi:uncharacterized protein DUF4382